MDFPGLKVGALGEEKLKGLSEAQVLPLFEEILRIYVATRSKLNKVKVAIPQSLEFLMEEKTWVQSRYLTGQRTEGNSFSARSLRGDSTLKDEIQELGKILTNHEATVQAELDEIINQAREEFQQALVNLR